jgi:ABC-2 type transport system ATP-binding protein
MEKAIIELVGLTKQYGSLKAVDNLDLTIRKGEIYGLLGPNGAGKTTTILMMLGLTEPTSGQVTVCGCNSTRNPVAVKRLIGYLPDNLGFYDGMSALDNVLYFARLNGMEDATARKYGLEIMELVGLADAMSKKAGTFSRGMKQRLGLAAVLVKQPEVIILDEPTLGIDPAGVREFLSFIKELGRQRNLTVVLSSHHLNQVQQICDRVGIFVGGKLIANDNIERLSEKIFGESQHVVDIVFADRVEGKDEYAKGLLQIEGVKNVEVAVDKIQVSSSRNTTPELIRFLVGRGLGIMAVQPKEHGLEEIYHRYFENAQNVENGISNDVSQRSFFKWGRR